MSASTRRSSAAVDERPDGIEYADAVRRLLAVVRTQLGMKVAWVSEFVGDSLVLRFVDAEPGANAPAEGTTLPIGGSYCARVLDGRFPALIPDTRQSPEAALFDVTTELHIGSYVGVPLLGPEGVPVGILCTVSDTAAPSLSERDTASLTLLADVLRDLQKRALTAAAADRQRDQLRFVLRTVIEGKGRRPVLQPVVDLATGRPVIAEGLTRFTLPSPVGGGDVRTPAQWFGDAERLGLRCELEVATAASVLDLLDDGSVPPDVALSVNLAPESVLSPLVVELLDGRDLSRVVVELTEHAAVADYDALTEALLPYRAAGLRVAVDDAGAGYASLTHVLAVKPDLMKIDMVLVRGADSDLARRTLLSALGTFGEMTGCRLVAEGVETQAELETVRDCGIGYAQGYLFDPPLPTPHWGRNL
ncbi:MAG: EAL domain-containing protein [Actinomycetes bacterium]